MKIGESAKKKKKKKAGYRVLPISACVTDEQRTSIVNQIRLLMEIAKMHAI